jgi:hypothetical protein
MFQITGVCIAYSVCASNSQTFTLLLLLWYIRILLPGNQQFVEFHGVQVQVSRLLGARASMKLAGCVLCRITIHTTAAVAGY